MAAPCGGKGPMGTRLLKAVGANKPPAFMKCQEWPCGSNNPTLGINLEYQTTLNRDTTVADRVWMDSHVKADFPPPPPWHVSSNRQMPSSTITLQEMLELA
eukprot:10646809-Karenia_brevis.AAC.1